MLSASMISSSKLGTIMMRRSILLQVCWVKAYWVVVCMQAGYKACRLGTRLLGASIIGASNLGVSMLSESILGASMLRAIMLGVIMLVASMLGERMLN